VKRITGGRWYHTAKDRTNKKEETNERGLCSGVDRKWLIKKKEKGIRGI